MADPTWERAMHASAYGVARVLWRIADAVGHVARAVDVTAEKFNEGGQGVMSLACAVSEKVRGDV